MLNNLQKKYKEVRFMDANVKEANKVRIETVIKSLEKRNITGH